jgi:hypothetical protein
MIKVNIELYFQDASFIPILIVLLIPVGILKAEDVGQNRASKLAKECYHLFQVFFSSLGENKLQLVVGS